VIGVKPRRGEVMSSCLLRKVQPNRESRQLLGSTALLGLIGF